VAKQGEGKKGGDEERVFVKDGFRSFRRSYRVGEVYWGAGTGALLLGVLGWVTWKGAHPDPSLFDMSAALEEDPGAAGAVPVDGASRRAGERLGAPRAEPAAAEPSGGAAATERGPLPSGLAQGSFHEGKIGQYSSDNLYVKINGRAGFFQAFGVKSLHTLTLEGPSSESGPSSVDIEAYDLAESRNAIGAYNGERPPGAESSSADGSTFHFDRNAGFLARGRYYVRFIGSDESPEVVAEVRRLLELFRATIPGEELPWGFALFVDQLSLSPSAVTYVKSNAFSFGFARDVFKAQLSAADSQEDMEAFVVALADADAARAAAEQYSEGFASLGKAAGTAGGVKWFEDEFLATLSGVTVVERWLIGVRGAPNAKRAADELGRLREALERLPEAVRARAVPSSNLDEPVGEYGGAAPDPAPGGAPTGSSPAGSTNPVLEDEGKAAQEPGKPAEEGSDEY
jgi:uncharacterized protein DUF6599